MMPGSKETARPPKAVLKEARSLLSSVTRKEPAKLQISSLEKESTKKTSGGPEAQHATNRGGRSLLLQCVRLVEEFHRLSLAEFQFEFKDWTVVKAVVELLVRWGIYPYLSLGVGIPLQKRFGEKAVAAAAAALSDNLVHDASTFEAGGSVASDSTDGVLETHPLVLSAEFLSSILLESRAREHDDSSTPGMTGHENNSDVKKEETVHGSRSTDEEDDPGFSSPAMALHQLVLSYHLVDVLAAILQAAYGASLTSNSLQASEIWKKNAAEIINLLVERLPAAHLVEALFILLGEAEGLKPPSWFKPEVGKLLSMAVMHDGGVPAVMERLVGSAEKGSVHVYERVATQLARVPRSVASKDLYYKGVCMQLQPLLVLSQSHSKFGSSSDIASRLVSNMHHTAILVACFLAHQDPELVEKYLILPILEPLLSSGVFQSQSAGLEKRANDISERVLVDSLLTVQALITAGHKGSVHLRKLLLLHTYTIAPEVMLLNYLLWPSYAKHDAQELEGKRRGVSKDKGTIDGRQSEGGPRKDFQKGFLINKNLSTSSSSRGDSGGPVGQFTSAVSDIVHAHLSQIPKVAFPIASAFLFALDTSFLQWPTADGEIADALKAGREQPDSSAVFLATLLLRSESWELAVSLLVATLKNVLKLRQNAQRRSNTVDLSQFGADIVKPETALQSLQALETLYGEVGLKAVEQDASGALPLLETLVEDEDLLADMEMLDLVLPLLHSALSQLQAEASNEERIQELKKGQKDVFLRRLEIALRKVQRCRDISEKQKKFAGEIRSMILEMLVYW
ncbi:unnamed protein product [Calypogeia fissa]